MRDLVSIDTLRVVLLVTAAMLCGSLERLIRTKLVGARRMRRGEWGLTQVGVLLADIGTLVIAAVLGIAIARTLGKPAGPSSWWTVPAFTTGFVVLGVGNILRAVAIGRRVRIDRRPWHPRRRASDCLDLGPRAQPPC